MGAYSILIGRKSICECRFQAAITSGRCAQALDPPRGDRKGEKEWFVFMGAVSTNPETHTIPKICTLGMASAIICAGAIFMARQTKQAKHKHYVLDEAKIKQAQKLLGTATKTETIERALDEVIAECERQARAAQAHQRFVQAAVKEHVEIRDVYGVLET
jgi:hypothetical protein